MTIHLPISATRFVSIVACLWPALLWAEDKDRRDLEFFEAKIRPVLIEHCYSCHSADAAARDDLAGGLLLDTRDGWQAGGDSGRVIVPGDPGASLLLMALRGDGDTPQMPPKGGLPEPVIADMERWIQLGAPDPRDGKSQSPAGIDWEASRQFWAFQKPTRHDRPDVVDTHWPVHDIDHFLLAKLESQGLHPVRPASRREWIRRATFDLTGLPPTIEEIEAFDHDESPLAFSKVLDRLLSSPHYGERWGRFWLDVARYADDKALAFPNPWPHAWRYRDWVVRALNDDMPYDQFVRLQLAGDLMTEPLNNYTQRLAGLGFQGLGALYHKGSVAEQVIADELDDRVDTLSRGLLGLTVACARCHDHKYDPIPTRDYYSLASAYKGANWTEVALAPPEVVDRYNEGQRKIKEQDDAIHRWLRDLGERRGQNQFEQISHTMQIAWRMNALSASGVAVTDADIGQREQVHPYFLKRFREFLHPDRKDEAIKRFPQLRPWFDHAGRDLKPATYEAAIIPDPIREIADAFQQSVLTAFQRRGELERQYQEALHQATSEEEKKKVKRTALEPLHEQLLKNLWLDGGGPLHADEGNTERQLLTDEEKTQLVAMRSELEQRKREAPPQYPIAHGVSGGGTAMPIYVRGDVKRKGEIAPPGFLRILDPQGETEGKGAGVNQGFSRLDLANAICSPQNPLTARVIVNRVWQHHFGRGIVATASNFGMIGERPTHPELLDTLAVQFIESGWSLKWLHRKLMLSSAYRLSSDQHAQNAAIDPDNRLLWRFTPRRLDVEAWRDAVLVVSGQLDRTVGGPAVGSTEAGHMRRTLYGMVSRREPDKMLIAFDFPDANVSSARRDVTIVPQQQLFVLNSDFMVQAAAAFAARLASAASSDQQRIALAYQIANGRDATADEMQFNLAFLGLAASPGSEDRSDAWGQLAQAILAANEFTWID